MKPIALLDIHARTRPDGKHPLPEEEEEDKIKQEELRTSGKPRSGRRSRFLPREKL